MSPTDKQKLRVQHKKTDFTQTVKGTSLSGKDQITSRNTKIMKGKKSHWQRQAHSNHGKSKNYKYYRNQRQKQKNYLYQQ